MIAPVPAPARLALDHLTVVDATPSRLVELAADAGYSAVCLFLHSMEVLPDMPQFDLRTGSAEFRAAKTRMADSGIGLDVAYPFTLSRRTEVSALRPALECAAGLGAWAVNVLHYDRDAGRRIETFSAFCELAREYGLNVVLEFFPQSQVKSLREALELVGHVDMPGKVGVNVDLLHLIRSGGTLEELASAPADRILYGQFCDAPAVCDPQQWEAEASTGRLLPGEGELDLAGFARALPPACRASIEAPRGNALSVPQAERARQAITALARSLSRRLPRPECCAR